MDIDMFTLLEDGFYYVTMDIDPHFSFGSPHVAIDIMDIDTQDSRFEPHFDSPHVAIDIDMVDYMPPPGRLMRCPTYIPTTLLDPLDM